MIFFVPRPSLKSRPSDSESRDLAQNGHQAPDRFASGVSDIRVKRKQAPDRCASGVSSVGVSVRPFLKSRPSDSESREPFFLLRNASALRCSAHERGRAFALAALRAVT